MLFMSIIIIFSFVYLFLPALPLSILLMICGDSFVDSKDWQIALFYPGFFLCNHCELIGRTNESLLGCLWN
jgi:hypothetical protein